MAWSPTLLLLPSLLMPVQLLHPEVPCSFLPLDFSQPNIGVSMFDFNGYVKFGRHFFIYNLVQCIDTRNQSGLEESQVSLHGSTEQTMTLRKLAYINMAKLLLSSSQVFLVLSVNEVHHFSIALKRLLKWNDSLGF
ncbi:hypothetical protein BT96DRAFT_948764 [Gymnopus androsaceus JB14]|uniref:Uncharacterized protein n=1 Tax=Gymnopus androsaceus JB14 TaxID=1447944 RepID=A0A6A4GNX4_9AGAR|nr:hypothetical protein BT96DRAFT_948764 [Gymnopus androsaceus JB14]